MNCTRTIIIGKQGLGKSTLALSLARKFHTAVLIWDPNRRFTAVGPVFVDVDALASYIDHYRSFTVVFQPSTDTKEMRADFAELVEELKGRGNYALIIDEASSVQDTWDPGPALSWLIRAAPRDCDVDEQGRKLSISIIQTTHRPRDINSLCRGLCTDWYIFRTVLSRDLKVVEEQFGDEIAVKVSRLVDRDIIHVWEDHGRTKFDTCRKPADWFTPIGRIGSTGVEIQVRRPADEDRDGERAA
jgi:AAA domain-containing protein